MKWEHIGTIMTYVFSAWLVLNANVFIKLLTYCEIKNSRRLKWLRRDMPQKNKPHNCCFTVRLQTKVIWTFHTCLAIMGHVILWCSGVQIIMGEWMREFDEACHKITKKWDVVKFSHSVIKSQIEKNVCTFWKHKFPNTFIVVLRFMLPISDGFLSVLLYVLFFYESFKYVSMTLLYMKTNLCIKDTFK